MRLCARRRGGGVKTGRCRARGRGRSRGGWSARTGVGLVRYSRRETHAGGVRRLGGLPPASTLVARAPGLLTLRLCVLLPPSAVVLCLCPPPAIALCSPPVTTGRAPPAVIVGIFILLVVLLLLFFVLFLFLFGNGISPLGVPRICPSRASPAAGRLHLRRG